MDNKIDQFEAVKQKKWLSDKKISRDITQKILKFGVSQRQIRNIIFLLSLELENSDDMKSIAAIVNKDDGNDKNTILIPGENNE